MVRAERVRGDSPVRRRVSTGRRTGTTTVGRLVVSVAAAVLTLEPRLGFVRAAVPAPPCLCVLAVVFGLRSVGATLG
ncbi:hypothetical protein C2R22_07680 [Salinigranum rubrum]|uniref:Uncharacterized protein n=1 Tax=Salinigranum rubrum TaxID=755307 RepID=A0A2I8VHZ9_9EURY|nr:hypothetical protein C2R22_07680 [Salinigranum rubrum]